MYAAGGFALIQPLVTLHKHIEFLYRPSGFVYKRALSLYQRDKHKLAYTHRECSSYCTRRHTVRDLYIFSLHTMKCQLLAAIT